MKERKKLRLSIPVGRRFGKLKVTEYLSDKKKYQVVCDCGQVEYAIALSLRKGKTGCRACQAVINWRRSCTINLALLDGVDEWLKLKICERYAEHLRVCEQWRIPPTVFRQFVDEMTDDPALAMEYSRLTISSCVDQFTKREFKKTYEELAMS